MTKYVITLEVEMDDHQTVDGVSIGNPARWDYNALLSADGFQVFASVANAYEACCESYVEWASADVDDRYPESNFAPYFHDEACVHFVAIEDDEDDEETDIAMLDTIFGVSREQLDSLTIFPKSEVK